MSKRWLPSIPLSLTVFLLWLLMVETATPGHILLALILAIVMPWVASRLEREFARIGSLRPIPRLAVVILGDIVRANIEVARSILGRESEITPGWIWVPLDLSNIHGISALTSVITLTPGTVSAELSEDRRHLLVHVFNLKDPQAEIDVIKNRYEAPLKELFP